MGVVTFIPAYSEKNGSILLLTLCHSLRLFAIFFSAEEILTVMVVLCFHWKQDMLT